jgi:hypothetical protein
VHDQDPLGRLQDDPQVVADEDGREARAVVGSSNTIMDGSRDRASAIEARWRMPPESSPG